MLVLTVVEGPARCTITTNRVKDISSFGQVTIIHLRKRRHVCPACKKKFYENVEFLPRYHRITSRLCSYILNEFTETRSMKSIACSNNISQTTAARAVDHVSYTPAELTEVLSIDEFRGNSGGVKFQCILTDPVNKTVFDILPTRSQEYLYWYYSKFKDSKKVKFVVMDMYKSYKIMAKVLFPNAFVIADKYHFTRRVTRAFERVRIEEQKKFSEYRRKAFKNSRSILLKHSDSLNLEEIRQVEVMLSSSEKLRYAYIIKENFEIFIKCKDSHSARKQLGYWNMYAMKYDLPEFENVAKTFSR